MVKEQENTVSVPDPFARRLMVQYLDRREKDLLSLREMLARGDLDAIRIKGHQLFGSGSAYGLDAISELGGRLEAAAIKGRRSDVGQLIDTLAAYIGSLRVV